jgi:hypothetical protein
MSTYQIQKHSLNQIDGGKGGGGWGRGSGGGFQREILYRIQFYIFT